MQQRQQKLSSSQFKSYFPDWIIVAILRTIHNQFGKHWIPFQRLFHINDLSISHPYASTQRVGRFQLYLYSTYIPCVIIIFLSISRGSSVHSRLRLSQVSLLGLLFSVSAVSVLTDILKCWIGNPRPDFIARCGPALETPVDTLVGLSVCTSPLGNKHLYDGLRSTPSGHSSMAFAGLLFLSLWIFNQYGILARVKYRAGLIIVSCLPVLVASYIAISRTQDYRHHFFDVIFGSSLGIVFAWFSHWKYFGNYSEVGES
ncbi:hypothetical protein CORT_0A07450 [Candida orthopsilosis Co 90-125]|uniref:Phosphatidic acid phosphatase type 2/haloperoxidase domain-containing protein n=1 Tax=Candida orthopsilosis (strain 90-125) TaxID=1136231 RepID=H8WWZ0_CANO9|nr:hypothetical protein CORT_0A07450 [Candida orthopsilosis Co 90-125]CCG21130.1 hypothetical protein CORT_0A07450 [Candida orthopsilosis Co 90-125]